MFHKLLVPKGLVGASGFEPPSSWSRTGLDQAKSVGLSKSDGILANHRFAEASAQTVKNMPLPTKPQKTNVTRPAVSAPVPGHSCSQDRRLSYTNPGLRRRPSATLRHHLHT